MSAPCLPSKSRRSGDNGPSRIVRAMCVLFVLTMPGHARADAFETYGDVAQLAIPGIALAASLIKEDYDGVAQLAFTSAVTVGTTYALKFGVNRERPDGGDHSFPSGHTASAFMGASYLHYRYGWQYGFPAYAAAIAVAVSRVEADKHYASDVVAAALLANAVAYVFTDTFDDNVSLLPFTHAGKKNFGITVRIRF